MQKPKTEEQGNRRESTEEIKTATKADGGAKYADVVVTSAGKMGQTVQDSAVPYEMVDLTTRVSH